MDKCFICHNLRKLGEGKEWQWVVDKTLVLKEEIIKWKCAGKIISRKVMKCERCIKELKELDAYRKPELPKASI